MLKLTYSPRPIPAAIEVAGGFGDKNLPVGPPSLGREALSALLALGAPGFIRLMTSLEVPPHLKAQACHFLMRGPALPYGIAKLEGWLQLRREVVGAVELETPEVQRLNRRVAHYEAVLTQLEEQQACALERSIDAWQRNMEMKREYRFFKREKRHGY